MEVDQPKPKLLEYLQLVVILVSVVWTVATIQGTTEKLGLRIDQLGTTITELKKSMDVQKFDVDRLKERVIVLEVKKEK